MGLGFVAPRPTNFSLSKSLLGKPRDKLKFVGLSVGKKVKSGYRMTPATGL